jgi:hypothetical protein
VHGIDYPGESIGEGLVEKPGMKQPYYYWDPVIARFGLTFYTGNPFARCCPTSSCASMKCANVPMAHCVY